MDLKEFRAFCSVAAGGDFGRAAAALGVAQSVSSRQVSALEAELGGRLFHRTGRGVLSTELGLAFLPRAFIKREMAGPLFAASRIVKPAIEQTTWLAVGAHRPVSLAVRAVARLVREILTTN